MTRPQFAGKLESLHAPIDGQIIVDRKSADLFVLLAKELNVAFEYGATHDSMSTPFVWFTRITLVFEGWFGVTVTSLHQVAWRELASLGSDGEKVVLLAAFFRANDRDSLEGLWRLGGDKALQTAIREWLNDRKRDVALEAQK